MRSQSFYNQDSRYFFPSCMLPFFHLTSRPLLYPEYRFVPNNLQSVDQLGISPYSFYSQSKDRQTLLHALMQSMFLDSSVLLRPDLHCALIPVQIFPPGLLYIVFQFNAYWTIIPGICQTSINIRAWVNEAPVFCKGYNFFHSNFVRHFSLPFLVQIFCLFFTIAVLVIFITGAIISAVAIVIKIEIKVIVILLHLVYCFCRFSLYIFINIISFNFYFIRNI